MSHLDFIGLRRYVPPSSSYLSGQQNFRNKTFYHLDVGLEPTRSGKENLFSLRQIRRVSVGYKVYPSKISSFGKNHDFLRNIPVNSLRDVMKSILIDVMIKESNRRISNLFTLPPFLSHLLLVIRNPRMIIIQCRASIDRPLGATPIRGAAGSIAKSIINYTRDCGSELNAT